MRVKRKNDELNDAIELLDQYYEASGHNADIASQMCNASDNLFINGELERCLLLPDYFLQNYYIIRPENQELQALFPYREEQDMIVEAMDEEWEQHGCCKMAIVKGRQFGGTTIVQARMFQHTIFHEQAYTMIVAQDKERSDHIINMSNTAYSLLPWWMKPEQKFKTKAEGITFQREDDQEIALNPGLGSVLRISHAAKAAGVAIGKSLSALHGSETSRWPNPEVWEGDLRPSMRAPNGFYIVESTGYGKNGIFYDFCMDIKHGNEEDWRLLFVPTYRVKRYSLPLKKGEHITLTEPQQKFHDKIKREDNFEIPPEAWKFRQYGLRRKNKAGFLESYPFTLDEAFQNSGRCAFDLDAIEEQRMAAPTNPNLAGEIKLSGKKPILEVRDVSPSEELPVRKTGRGGHRLWIWEMPQKDAIYYLGSDASAGVKGGDYSCCEVWKLGMGFDEKGRPCKNVQVAEWWGWENPKRYARIVLALGYLYNAAEISNEYQMAGMTVGDTLVDEDYPNLWRPRHKDRAKMLFTVHVHWVTTTKTRDLIIGEMQDALLMNTVIVNSQDLLEEMSNFAALEGSGKFEGVDDNDDGVMSAMIGLYCMTEAFRYERESSLSDGVTRPSQVDPSNPNPLWGVIPFEWTGPWVIRNSAMQMVSGRVYSQKEEAERLIKGREGLKVMPHWAFAAANPWISPLHQQTPNGYWGSNLQYQAKRVLELTDAQVTPSVMEAFKAWKQTVRETVDAQHAGGGYEDDW